MVLVETFLNDLMENHEGFNGGNNGIPTIVDADSVSQSATANTREGERMVAINEIPMMINQNNALVSENDPFFADLGAEFSIPTRTLFALFKTIFILPHESSDLHDGAKENDIITDIALFDNTWDTLLERFQQFHANTIFKVIIPSNYGVAQEFSSEKNAKEIPFVEYDQHDSDYPHLPPCVIVRLMDSVENLFASFTENPVSQKQKAFSLLRRIVVNLCAEPSSEKYRSISLPRGKISYLDERFSLFLDFLENLGFCSISSASSTTESGKNMWLFLQESPSWQRAHAVTYPLRDAGNESVNSPKEKTIRLVVMRPVDAEFQELLQFSKIMLQDILEELSTSTGIPQAEALILPPSDSEKDRNALENRKISGNLPSAQSSAETAFPKFLKPKARLKSEKLNKQLNEVRQLARDRHALHQESPQSMPTKFTLRGMTPSQTNEFIRTSMTKKNISDRFRKIPLKNKSMSLRDFEKPIFDWRPENCEFRYSDEFRIRAGYKDLTNLSEMRKLMFDYEYIGRMALDYTNHYRKLHSLRLLEWSQDLMKIGIEHCENMADLKVPVGHDGVAERFKKYPFTASRSGENVAFMQGIYEIAKTAVDGWIHSPGHEKNLRGDYTLCGISISSKSSRFYLTQLFGSRA
ncbi:hypothetical protein IE077_003158 [Cardiosporidium cionae]|uniref:SCP domain-containing protein n=1 Tax=Cardiosporidium cionae TaxID=476202 RepID=A0ABQ7J8Z7_9APIC|nr:hypothetical protein IE077_003158 [Cardiosporidium cionae]|eukprot:KAF8820457.1 hypothetical protein IE077_003158 [Cardiosporidium cionae]